MIEIDAAEAKKAGLSAAEIQSIQQQIKAAQAEGYSDEEIQQYIEHGVEAGDAGAVGGASSASSASSAGSASGLPVFLQGVAHGTVSSLGYPGTVAANTNHMLAAHGYSPANLAAHGYPALLPNPLSLLPTESALLADMHGAEHSLGITPPNASGFPLTQAAGRGMGAMLPFALGGGLSEFASALAAGATSGIGGGLGHQIAPGTPADPWLTGAGSILGLPVGTALSSVPIRLGNLLLDDRTPMGELFHSTGLPMRSAAFTTASDATRRRFGQYAPLDATNQDIGNAIEAHAAGLGGSRTYSEAGTAAQNAARQWVNETMPEKEAQAWSGVDSLIPNTTPAPLSNFRNILATQAAKGGVLKNIVKSLPGASISDNLKSQLDNLDSLLRSKFDWINKPAIGSYPPQPGAMPEVVPNWADARALRTALGHVMGAPSVISTGVAKQLEPLYAGLTQDLQSAADKISPEARSAFDSANATSTNLHSFNKDIISKIIKNDNPEQAGITPEQAASNILRGGAKGGTILARLRTELPQAANELSAAEVRTRGLTAEPDIGNIPGASAHPNFSGRWSGLSPEMREALIPDPAARSQMDDLSTLAKSVATTAKARPLASDRLMETAAGAAGGMLTGALFSHGSPYGDILGSAIGAGGGFGVNTLFGAGRQALSNSALLAHLAAARAPLTASQLLVATPTLTTNSLLGGQ